MEKQIVLELTKNDEVFAYVMFNTIAHKLASGQYKYVTYHKPRPIRYSYQCQQRIEVDSIEITVEDLLLKKYREIDISVDRIIELRKFMSYISNSSPTDMELLRKVHNDIEEIGRIRYELGIRS